MDAIFDQPVKSAIPLDDISNRFVGDRVLVFIQLRHSPVYFLVPNNSEIRFHLARALDRADRGAEAVEQLEAIFYSTPQYERIDEVISMLKRLQPDSKALDQIPDNRATESQPTATRPTPEP